MTTTRLEGYIASNQTGKFPVTSTRGMNYLCIFYIHDSNFIKSIPIKSRQKGELHRAYEEVYQWCTQRGYKPKVHKLDNETSKEVEAFISEQQTKIQYTPFDMHQSNPAKRAIQTWKSCMKSTLASLLPRFPIGYWCRLLAQIDLSVNIVRPCRINPRLSAWAAMEGEYHFSATPIAPPGSKMLMHENPGRRQTFGYNAKKSWYTGP